MKLSTQTILTLGIIQCVILTLILVLFLRLGKAADEVSVPVELDAPAPRDHGVTPIPATDSLPAETPAHPSTETTKGAEPTLEAPSQDSRTVPVTKEYPDGVEPV